MHLGKNSNIVERFCPVVGKNVVMRVNTGKGQGKPICLNNLSCNDINGGCKNKSIIEL